MVRKVAFLTLALIFSAPGAHAEQEKVRKIDNAAIESVVFTEFKDPKRLPNVQIFLNTKETLYIPCGEAIHILIDSDLDWYSNGRLSRNEKGQYFLWFRSKREQELIMNGLDRLKSHRACANVS